MQLVDDRAVGSDGEDSHSDSDDEPRPSDDGFLDDGGENMEEDPVESRARAESHMRRRDARNTERRRRHIFSDDESDSEGGESGGGGGGGESDGEGGESDGEGGGPDALAVGAFPLSEEMRRAEERREAFLRERDARRERGQDRSGFTPERQTGGTVAARAAQAPRDEQQGESETDVDREGSQEFRDAIHKIRVVNGAFRAMAERARLGSDGVVEEVRDQMEALGEAHGDAGRSARTDAQRERVTSLSRRTQLMGHSISCMAKHASNIKTAMNPDANSNAEIPLHSVEEFLGYEDLYNDKLKGARGLFTPFHQLLDHVMGLFRAAGYRREGEDVYGKIKTAGGHSAVAWERKYSIVEFVNLHVRKSVNLKMWLIKAKEKNPVPRIVDHLCSSNEIEFSNVNSSRTLFSFENGVYDADKNAFNLYPLAGDSPLLAKGAPSAGNHFAGVEFPVADQEALEEDRRHYENIDTAVLDSVLEFQDIPREAIMWLYFSIGRMIYPIGTHDDLQYFPFFDGAAGCGKSTIIKVIQALYDKAKVGIVSNNIETTFGLSSLYEKWICVAPEIKSDWKISVTEFQSMASGESVSIAVKNKNTVQKEWTSPVALAGNEIPGFNDIAGSVSRRLLPFKFVNKPEREDATLLARILGSMGHIILKANSAYRYMVGNGYRASLWDKVPPYFREIRAEVQRSINPLIDFMEAGKFVKDLTRDRGGGARYKTEYEDFKESVKDYVKEKHGGKKLDERSFELHKVKPILAQYGFEVEYEKRLDGRENRSRIGAVLYMREATRADHAAARLEGGPGGSGGPPSPLV